jgi:hypothetical protein
VIKQTAGGVTVEAAAYRWRWSRATDEAVLSGPDGRAIVRYPLQPGIVVTGREAQQAGTCAEMAIDSQRLRVAYDGVHGRDRTEIALRFEAGYFVIERVTYAPADDGAAVVRLEYFCRWRDGVARPAGRASTCVIPGGKQDPEQAIFRTADADDVVFSIGCFGMGTGTNHQQWALPHYLLGCYDEHADGVAASAAAIIGLGGVPDGNVVARVDRGAFSYEINVRGDLWGHRAGPAQVRFDDPLVVAVADDWYEAGLRYFDALRGEGFAPTRDAADAPASAFWPQYDTWGDQGARRCFLERFDEPHLREIYRDFRQSGLRARLFVIDDKWEDVYGSMSHDTSRFPHFIQLLDEIRADGHEIGLWTAFPRCEDFRALGLTEASVLACPDGTPYVEHQRKRSWYVFDPTDPAAAAHLRQRARHLIETYRPALVKIDFGYEIPTPDVAGPHDPRFGGERLFQLFLEIIVGEIKRVDPGVTILYYCVTPLFGRYIDQCGMDDLWMSRGAYADGFARRALLASWCGAFGMVPYGSSGYDWRSAAEIWLDSAIIGTPGVIAPLAGDEYGEHLTPALAALYNGIARVTRREPYYRVQFLDADLLSPDAGPRARSWARIEHDATVTLALRPDAHGRAVAPGIAEADFACVIASMGADDIRACDRLGIVPFGRGSVSIERTHPRAATATARLLSGATLPAEVERNATGIIVRILDAGDDPIEIVEVEFA